MPLIVFSSFVSSASCSMAERLRTCRMVGRPCGQFHGCSMVAIWEKRCRRVKKAQAQLLALHISHTIILRTHVTHNTDHVPLCERSSYHNGRTACSACKHRTNTRWTT
eukprot:m.45642 g.45642  ORF g.45642 m.45642 type:complete len:108 (-) comp7230_c0_seq1:2637-2960(-)